MQDVRAFIESPSDASKVKFRHWSVLVTNTIADSESFDSAIWLASLGSVRTVSVGLRASLEYDG